MLCPKCRKPLFEDEKCSFCDWVKVEPPRPAQPQRVQQPVQQAKPTQPLSPTYIAMSWVMFSMLLVIGGIRCIAAMQAGEDTIAYKSIILCLASCLFIPQIRIKSIGMPWVEYGIKLAVAALLVLIL